MFSLERRLERMAAALGGYQPICPACQNAPVNIVKTFDVDGSLLEESGERC